MSDINPLSEEEAEDFEELVEASEDEADLDESVEEETTTVRVVDDKLRKLANKSYWLFINDEPHKVGFTACCVRGLINNKNAKELLNKVWMVGVSCIRTEECFNNYMITIFRSLSVNDRANAKAADLFYKLRHDYFAKQFLHKALGVELRHTDTSFRKEFGIDSDKTPDYFHYPSEDDIKVVDIYEFAVTVSSDFADSLKGVPTDSKYEREIQILRQEGYTVTYKPIIFRLDKKYEELSDEWNAMGLHADMQYLHGIYKDLTDQFYQNFHHLFLYNEKDFKSDFAENDWKTMTHNRKKFFKVNIRTKQDVVSSYRTRMRNLISSYKAHNHQISFVYNANIGTLSAVKSETGMYALTLDDWLSSGFDTEKIFNYITIIDRGVSYESNEFSVVENIGKTNYFSKEYENHNTCIDINDDNYLSALEKLGLENINEFSSDCVGPPEFPSGVPAPFDFENVLNKAIEVVEKPITTEGMLCEYSNYTDSKQRNYDEMCSYCENINSEEANTKFFPKSSFLCFIKPPGEVKQKGTIVDFSVVKEMGHKLNDTTLSILKRLRDFPYKEPKAYVSLNQMDPIRQKYEEMRQEYKDAKARWLISDNAKRVYKDLLRFKDDKSEEAEAYKKATKKLELFNAKHSTILRTYNLTELYNRIPILGEISKEIKKELSRDHNYSGRKGTGKYRKSETEWDKQELGMQFSMLCNDLISQTDEHCEFKLQYDGYNKTTPFFNSLKELGIGKIKEFEELISRTALGATLEFNCVLFKSIAFLSTVPFKGKTVAVETSGLKDTILLVKGGKVNQSESKAFKVITTIHPSFKEFYNCFDDPRSKWRIFEHDGKVFMETPWLRYQHGMIEHFHTLKFKLSNFIISMSEEINLESYKLEKFALPILVSLNARRKLEVLLFGFRQLVMNFRARYANVTQMFNKTLQYSTDYLYYYVVNYILEVMKNLIRRPYAMFDWITGTTETNVIAWTINMYCSRLLPKAAVDYQGELRNDIIAFLETYEDCKVDRDTKLENYETQLGYTPYDNDLQFSPELCWLVGVYISDYIKTIQSQADVLKGIKRVYYTNIFKTANNRGCRLDPDMHKEIKGLTIEDYLKLPDKFDVREVRKQLATEKDSHKREYLNKLLEGMEEKRRMYNSDEIFGYKGYQAYLETFPIVDCTLVENALQCAGPVSASVSMKKDKTTLFSYFKEINNGEIVDIPTFSIHAKSQWGDKREIFAATVKTKITQQLAEGVFKVLCKHLPNEMIAIPSNRRTNWLHTTIHQRVDQDTHVMSLDYRRWGPHSNFLKYKYMLMGMIDLIPPSFYEFFIKLVPMMEKKRIIIRKEDFKAIYNHAIVKEVINKNDIMMFENYIMIKEPHSFVMGIYNYLSSLMHAGSQLLYRHLIMMSDLKRTDKKLDFYGIAHSDDAQVMIKSSTEGCLYNVIKSYETFGKYLNHMQSNKKSQVDDKSSEVISILRIDKKVISMLAKFTAGISVAPSFKGYSTELKDLTSKVIELVANGATFNQAYCCYRTLVYYWGYYIYHFNYPRYDYPVEVFGTPDDYPLFQLLYGTRVNFFTNYYYNRANNLKVQKLAREGKGLDLIEGIKYISNTRNLKHIRKDVYASKVSEKLEDLLRSDSLIMLNFTNDTLLKMQVIARMRDPAFAAAMAGGHLFTGLSYLLKNNAKLVYSFEGDTVVPWYCRELVFKKLDGMETPYIDKTPLDYLLNDLKMFTYLPNKFKFEFTQTILKPCSLVYEISAVRGLRTMPYKKLHCYINEPEFRNLMDITPTEKQQIELFNELAEGMTISEKEILGQSICQESSRHFYFYASLPTLKKQVNGRGDIANLISYNTLRGRYIPTIDEKTLPETLTDIHCRTTLESVYLVNGMLKYIPDNLKSDFIQNYQIQVQGKNMKLQEIYNNFRSDPNPYNQVLSYQVGYLIKAPEINKLKPPLFNYTKTQIGAGSVWFGDGRIDFRTRNTFISASFVNEKFKHIYINKSALIEDLNYFINEMVQTTLHNPFYKKLLSKRNNELCIGFNDINSIDPDIGTQDQFRFIYPDVTFTDDDIRYPKELQSIDIRKVKRPSRQYMKEMIYFVRLGTSYLSSSSMKNLEIEDNYNWCLKNLKISCPWFKPKHLLPQLECRYHADVVCQKELAYAFNTDMKPSPMEGKVDEVRKYIPGISQGIVECILRNRPDYLRTPNDTAMWSRLCRQYPASFINSIYKERVQERTRDLNQYLKKLESGEQRYVLATKTYINECLSIVDWTGLCHRSNLIILIESFVNHFDSHTVCTLIDMIENSKFCRYFDIPPKVAFYYLTKEFTFNLIFIFLKEIKDYLERMTPDEYDSLQKKLGKPWSLLPNDTLVWRIYFFQVCAKFKDAVKNFIAVHTPPDLNEPFEKLKLRMKCMLFKIWLDKIDIRLYDYMYHYIEDKKPYLKCTNPIIDYGLGIPGDFVLYGKSYPGERTRPKKIFSREGRCFYDDETTEMNTLWYTDMDDIIEDSMDCTLEYGKKRITREKVMETGRRANYIAGTNHRPIHRERAFEVIYSTNYMTYVIKSEGPVRFLTRWPFMKFIVHPKVFTTFCSVDKEVDIKEHNGVEISYDELADAFNINTYYIDRAGNLLKPGFMANQESGIDQATLVKIKALIESPDDVTMVSFHGMEMGLTVSQIMNIAKANVEKEEKREITKVYEPLGSFINDVKLRAFFEQAFPTTYMDLLKGRIKVPKSYFNAIKPMLRKLTDQGRGVAIRVLKSVSIVSDMDAIGTDEVMITGRFWDEYCRFIDPTADDATQEEEDWDAALEFVSSSHIAGPTTQDIRYKLSDDAPVWHRRRRRSDETEPDTSLD